MNSDAAEINIDGADAYTDGSSFIFLRKGLNFIDIKSGDTECVINKTKEKGFSVRYSADEFVLKESAVLSDGYVDGISCNSGKAEVNVNVPKDGNYRITVEYSNNDEGGVHSYNVDLIERVVTINGQNLWCRNTYSWDTVKTATMNMKLTEGENTIILSNDGSVKFNGKDSYAPHIYSVTVSEICS